MMKVNSGSNIVRIKVSLKRILEIIHVSGKCKNDSTV